MDMHRLVARLPLDPFLIGLLCAVGLASVAPARGGAIPILDDLIALMIALMFFLYGARLAPQVVLAGLAHWRLHVLVLACTFGLFPALGLATGWLVPGVLTPALQAGILFLSLLPSTVQSSIAFTSIAGGNVAAAICSATASNLVGVVATPVLVGLLMRTAAGGVSLAAAGAIVLQILLPFVVGQASRPLIAGFAERHRTMLMLSDRGAILLVVYSAFGEAVRTGLWSHVPLGSLASLVVVDAVLLACVLGGTTVLARLMSFDRADEIAIVFCGSKKSLATGVPMATVLFPAHDVGAIVLPVMLFHQLQLMACAFLARRYAAGTLRQAAV